VQYFLTSPHLGFRCWTEEDLPLATEWWCDPKAIALIGAGATSTYPADPDRASGNQSPHCLIATCIEVYAMRKMALFLTAFVALFTWLAWAADASKELSSAAEVMQSMTASKQVPSKLLGQSKCIAVIPNLTKAGLGIGGEHGDGVVSCRTSSGWSAPAFISMKGGSVGLQAGVTHQDIILLMNDQGAQQLRSGHWDLGAEAVAAGPSGGAEASETTGWKAPVLSYTRSKGVYAGANLEGSKISADEDMIHNQYSKNTSFTQVLDGQVKPPASAQPFMSALKQVSHKTTESARE
jgi:SH3 domain-containing YSC84-like protein 1